MSLVVICKVHREVPNVIFQNKRLRILRAIKKGQPRKTGNIEHAGRRQTKQNKNTIQYVLDTTICKQAMRHLIENWRFKGNRTSFLCVRGNGHHNTELKSVKTQLVLKGSIMHRSSKIKIVYAKRPSFS
jgi:hypothetical protein